jgi:hypothetical protein
MEDQLGRLRGKIAAAGIRLNPCLSLPAVESFERAHGILLPAAFRLFLLHIGNGGKGPPGYGIPPLGSGPLSSYQPQAQYWQELPDVARPFPFTKAWVWERGERTTEGTHEQVNHGSIYIGEDGCGQDWHLIVTGPERGNVWNFDWAGISPTEPRRDFLQWYEDWLDRPLVQATGLPRPSGPQPAVRPAPFPSVVLTNAERQQEARKGAVFCPLCGAVMKLRQSRRRMFWGCSKYPRCKGVREIGEGEPA